MLRLTMRVSQLNQASLRDDSGQVKHAAHITVVYSLKLEINFLVARRNNGECMTHSFVTDRVQEEGRLLPMDVLLNISKVIIQRERGT